jgi:hypothetical protein
MLSCWVGGEWVGGRLWGWVTVPEDRQLVRVTDWVRRWAADAAQAAVGRCWQPRTPPDTAGDGNRWRCVECAVCVRSQHLLHSSPVLRNSKQANKNSAYDEWQDKLTSAGATG